MRIGITIAFSLVLVAPRGWTQPVDSPFAHDFLTELERRGSVVGDVLIRVGNVFNLTNPEEDKKLYRAANHLHVKTRERVIKSIILFEPGDRFSTRVLEETERLLRSRGFIADASVLPVRYHEATNAVDIEVRVRDAWSFKPEMRLSRNGGKNKFGFGLQEGNLLGTGKDLTVSYVSDVDRDTTRLRYVDPNLLGGRTRLEALTADNSDGQRHLFAAGRPFFALDTRWAVGGQVLDEQRVDSIYDLGEVVDEFEHRQRFLGIQGGWSRGLIDDWTRRWLVGLVYDDNTFVPTPDRPTPTLLPQDRKLVYPWVGLQWVENDFREMTRVNNIGRVEDISFGLELTLRLGYASERLGSDRNAWVFSGSATKGWDLGAGRYLFFDSSATNRWETGGTRNALLQASARYLQRDLRDQVLAISLGATATDRLDADSQVLLGGDSGLRGYPLRYQSGRHRAVLTVEQRFFTDWYPWRLFRVGSAVFFDAGRTWGQDPRGEPSRGMLYDVGVGLRLSSPHSSSGTVVHIDLAFPLNRDSSIDSAQLLVETKGSF
jgi:hypothetical protein